MIGVKNSLQLDWNAAIIKNSKLSWISIDNTKPLRNLKYSIHSHHGGTNMLFLDCGHIKRQKGSQKIPKKTNCKGT